jgi:ankyrin repeat protein
MNRIDQVLIEAAGENNLPDVRQLVRAGADIEAKSIFGRNTPLHEASLKGQVQVVKELLEHGADTEAKDDDDWTALHYAAQ